MYLELIYDKNKLLQSAFVSFLFQDDFWFSVFLDLIQHRFQFIKQRNCLLNKKLLVNCDSYPDFEKEFCFPKRLSI